MAIKQVVISDIGGAELDDGQAAKVIITEHPALEGRPVELDVSSAEADKLMDDDLYLVQLTVQQPGRATRQVTMQADTFDALFGKTDISDVLQNARVSSDESPRRRRRAASTSGTSTGKADYTSPEHAGQLHRGRVTEAEAEWVRNNLEAANANRAKAGQQPIDPTDAKEKQRYGF